MTESQDTLQIVQANRKFYEYIIEEKDKIEQEESQKVLEAQQSYCKMMNKLQLAPQKLLEAKKNENTLQKQIEKEREIPASDREEVLSLVDIMKTQLRKLGIAC